MTIAFDKVTTLALGTGDRNFNHVPVGTPRGVIVYIVDGVGTDQVVGVTYGGTAMTEITGSPQLQSGGEGGSVHAFWLGASIPTGTQSVAIDRNDATSYIAACYTVTADFDTAIQNVQTSTSTSTASPGGTLVINVPSFISGGLYSGSNNPGSTAPAGTANDITGDFGTDTAAIASDTDIQTANFAFTWSQTADDGTAIVIAMREKTQRGIGQAQAWIKTTSIGYGQANTDIKAIGRGFGQALALIPNWFNAQAQAYIKVIGNGSGQANAYILNGHAHAQANALINGSAIVVQDGFGRGISNGWGTADSGGDWTVTQGSASNFNTDGNGIIIDTLSTQQVALNSFISKSKVEIKFQFYIEALPSTTHTLYILSNQGSSGIDSVSRGHSITIDISETGVLTATIAVDGNGVSINDTITDHELWNVKAHFIPNNTDVTRKLKIWKDINPEPGWGSVTGIARTGARFNASLPGHAAVSTAPGTAPAVTWRIDNLNIFEAFQSVSGQAQAKIKAIGYGFGQSQTWIKSTVRGYGQALGHISGQAVVVDTASSIVASGWGTPDTGPDWVGTTFLSKDGSIAKMSFTTIQTATAYQSRIDLKNLEYKHDVKISAIPASGSLSALSYFRINDSVSPSTFISFNTQFTTGNNINFNIIASDSSGNSTVTNSNYLVGYSINTFYTVKYKVIDATATQIFVYYKLWQTGTTEPEWSSANFSKSSHELHNGGGFMDVGINASSGQTQIVSFDNITANESIIGGAGQAQADIKTQGNGLGQAQVKITGLTTSTQSGQAQADILATQTAFGQTQADIRAIGNGLAQAQADIKVINFGLGQSQADIKTQNSGFGQSQTNIKAIGNGLGQAQTDIKAVGNGSGQANSDIKATNNGFGQAQCTIKGNAFAQSQVDIKATYTQSAQAQTDIKAIGNGLGQAQADIKTIGNGLGQSQADIKTVGYGSGQSNADIKAVGNGSGQAQSDIKVTTNQFAQAQTDIKQTYSQFAQAQADIKVTQTGSGQAQADIKSTSSGSGQANASIAGAIQQYAQAQADIKTTEYGFGQSQTDIKQLESAFAQSQADIKHTYYGAGQAQASIVGNAFGQAQADVKTIYTQSAQAQTDILVKTSQSAQAQSDIKQTSRGFAQAQADILHIYTGSGQAQASIKGNAFAQAQADIKSVQYGSGQTQALIGGVSIGSGQANSDIKATNRNYAQAQTDVKVTQTGSGQSQSDIKSVGYGAGQAQCNIRIITQGSGQANSDIKAVISQVAQAQTDIRTTYTGSGQANSDIRVRQSASAQAQAYIKLIVNGYGQAQTNIHAISSQSAQSQADILVTNNKSANAQTWIKITVNSYGQAQARITSIYAQFGQAQAAIQSIKTGSAQAQALIGALGLGLAQAQALIIKPAGYGQAATRMVTSFNLKRMVVTDHSPLSLSIIDYEVVTPQIQEQQNTLILSDSGITLDMIDVGISLLLSDRNF